MLTLRTKLGLTQAGLADLLHVSRRAVAEWEAGSSYPKAEHLKQVIALGVQQQTFAARRAAEEIRAFWKAAVLPLSVVDNSVFSPIRLTLPIDPAYPSW
jgi:transcriptional regulator with XRE-family HTH domain